MKTKFSFLLFLMGTFLTFSQGNQSYWQQHVDYKMEVEMNTKNYRYSGKQELVYTNNSPDTVMQIFYHLYYYAFHNIIELDHLSRSLPDPTSRSMQRLSTLYG